MEQEPLLNETDSRAPVPVAHAPQWHEPTMIDHLREALTGLMQVEEIKTLTNAEKPVVQFGGRLMPGDVDEIFDEIVRRFAVWDYTPLLSEANGLHIIQAAPFVADNRTGKVWVNALLFVLTLLAVLFTGALQELGQIPATLRDLLTGFPFAASLLGILLAHELSHYFVGRRYNSPVSLPYFIPLPLFSPLGTMGAVIVQRGPMRSRKALFDIGVAGPLGGLIVAIPILIGGLLFTEVGNPHDYLDVPAGEPIKLTQEGNSLLYMAAKYVVHHRILPDRETGDDVWLSPPSRGGSITFAAWAGLFVTALNLLPIGQLDGGHVAYAMWGPRAWKIAKGFLNLVLLWGALLLILGNPAGFTWLLLGGLGSLMGVQHFPPLNDLTPLDRNRRILGWIVVLIFILTLVPIPLIEITL